QRSARRADLLHGNPLGVVDALAPLLTPYLDGRADVLVPLEAIGLFPPAEHCHRSRLFWDDAPVADVPSQRVEAASESWRRWDGKTALGTITGRSSSTAVGCTPTLGYVNG